MKIKILKGKMCGMKKLTNKGESRGFRQNLNIRNTWIINELGEISPIRKWGNKNVQSFDRDI